MVKAGSPRGWGGWMLAGLLAACYAPRVPAGVLCDPDAPSCPEGQRCVSYGGASACENPSDDGPDASPDSVVTDAGDGDGDGIPNLTDNCPALGNPLQRNEDGDRFGDVCDPCPPVASDAPADADGDGVADACDPNPTIAGEVIAFFEGFEDGLAGWRQFGTWSASNGAVSVTVTDGEHASLSRPAPVAVRRTITSAFLVTSLNGATPYAGFGVVDEHEIHTDSGLACQVYRNAIGLMGLGLTETGDERLLDQAAFPMVLGERYTTSLTRDGTSYRCRGSLTGQPDANVAGTSNLDAITPEIALRVHRGAGTFLWVLVVTTP